MKPVARMISPRRVGKSFSTRPIFLFVLDEGELDNAWSPVTTAVKNPRMILGALVSSILIWTAHFNSMGESVLSQSRDRDFNVDVYGRKPPM